RSATRRTPIVPSGVVGLSLPPHVAARRAIPANTSRQERRAEDSSERLMIWSVAGLSGCARHASTRRYAPTRLVSVEPPHADVEEDHLGPVALEHREAALAVVGRPRLSAHGLDEHDRRVCRIEVVVDHED